MSLLLRVRNFHEIIHFGEISTKSTNMSAIFLHGSLHSTFIFKEVPEENIVLVSLLMAESGVHTIAYAFPKVQIITTAGKIKLHFWLSKILTIS